MPIHRLRGLLGASVVLVLTGCASFVPITVPVGSSVADFRAIEGGECFQGVVEHGEPVLDVGREVPCTREHEMEVLQTVVLPEPWSAMSYDEVMVLTEIGAEVYEHVMPQCRQALWATSGLARRLSTVNSLDGELGQYPGVLGAMQMYVAPSDVWGQHPAIYCVYEQWDEQDGLTSFRSATSAPALATFAKPEGPVEMRWCLNYTEVSTDTVSCAEPHHAEVLFEFDAVAYFGDEWVAAVDKNAPADAVWADVDKVCGAAASAVFGGERTLFDVAVQGNLLGARWVDDTDRDGVEYINDYPVACVVVVTDAAVMLDGPVWGLGNAPAPLVAAPDDAAGA